MNQLPLPVLIVLIVAAVALGLYLGARAGRAVAPDSRGGQSQAPVVARVRSLLTNGVVRLWVWNRDRKKRRDRERS